MNKRLRRKSYILFQMTDYEKRDAFLAAVPASRKRIERRVYGKQKNSEIKPQSDAGSSASPIEPSTGSVLLDQS